jgi:uncharacterized PurR-regulated membrane protein YhhQ (DUF165 family)
MDFVANWLAAAVLLHAGPFLIPGGTFMFSLSFGVYDYIRRYYGTKPTVAAIGLGLSVSLLYAATFGGGIGRIAIAGILALCVSSPCDLFMQRLTLRWRVWSYVTASNAISLLFDTLVFTTVAFAALPAPVRATIFEGQYLAKLAMLPLTIALVYLVRRGQASPRPQLAAA